MKKITLLMSALLFTVMSFAQGVLFTQTFPGEPSNYTSAYNKSFTLTTDGYTLTYANINNGQQKDGWTAIRSGSKNFESVATIASAKVAATVSKVVVNFTQVDANNTNALYLEVSATEDFTTVTKVDATIATGEVVFAITAPAADQYYRVSIDQKKGSANGFNRLDKVIFFGEGGETPETPDTPTEPETPEVPEGVITCAEAVAICEETGTTSTTESYTIQGYVTEIKTAYNSSFNNITFWMADTKDGGQVLQCYRVKPVNAGEENVKVGDYVEVNGTLVNYYGNTPEVNAGGTYTILVAAEGGETPEEPETPELPYGPEVTLTCAQALEVCLATGTTSTAEVYTIQGYVTEIKDVYSEQYNNIAFWMADTQDGGQVLLAYRVKPILEGEENVKVGDKVEVKGTLVNYSGNTPEVNAGGTYTILVAGEGGETPDTPVEPEEPETPSVELVGDGTEANPFTVEDVIALNNTLSGTHYVKAYIVGQATGGDFAEGLDLEAPFEAANGATQGTNLAIASSLTPDVANIIPVQLPKGELRDAVNLVEHPELLGKQVLICGELIKYFQLTGIKNPTSIVVLEDSEATGLENVIATDKVAKVIKNGQIYIIKGGKTYNALGAEVK